MKDTNKELEEIIEELENKAETQELKTDQLEKTLDEKIVENEMQRMTIDKKISSVPKENFGLSENQLKALSEYGSVFV